MCAKFQLNQSMHSRVRVIFVFVRKEEDKNEEQKPKLWSLVSQKRLAQFTSTLECSFLLYPPQIWCSSDKRSRIYECMKIATLLFLLI